MTTQTATLTPETYATTTTFRGFCTAHGCRVRFGFLLEEAATSPAGIRKLHRAHQRSARRKDGFDHELSAIETVTPETKRIETIESTRRAIEWSNERATAAEKAIAGELRNLAKHVAATADEIMRDVFNLEESLATPTQAIASAQHKVLWATANYGLDTLTSRLADIESAKSRIESYRIKLAALETQG